MIDALFPDDAYFLGAIFLVIIEVIFIIKKVPVIKNILIALFIVYSIMVISITIFPIYFKGIMYHQNYNFIPFASILETAQNGTGQILRNILGNMIMFIPFGVLLPISFCKKRLLQVFLLALMCSVGIELLQWLIGILTQCGNRSVDIDDVILNTSGAIIGYGIYKLIPDVVLRLVHCEK